MTSEEDIKRIRELMEFLVRDRIREKLENLGSDERKVYDLTGDQKRVEMAKATGFAAGKVSEIWQGLESKGLLVKDGKFYRKVI